MSDNTYLFYDIETTGLNKCFDQVLQFAAIRTDLNFKEIERVEIPVALRCDVIPHPQAVITHRIGVSEYTKGSSEYEASQKIHALLNAPGTISLGYNSLGFDDEFLRFSFYRNLLPPYTHQYANGCARMDLYPIALLYFLFKKEALKWPEGNLKLENISACNGFLHTKAHDAMSDVEATLALARQLSIHNDIWSFVATCFQKAKDESRLHKTEKLMIDAQAYALGFLVHNKIGAKDNFIAPVIYLGPHLHYKNQSLFLRLDTHVFSTDDIKVFDNESPNASASAINTRVIKKRFGEPPFFLPLKERYYASLSDDRKKIAEQNKKFLLDHPNYFSTIQQHYQHEKYQTVPSLDIDAALYDAGFPAPALEKLFCAFHKAKPDKKMDVAVKFSDPLRYGLAVRIMGRYYPECLDPEDAAQFQQYRNAERIIDYRGEQKLTSAMMLAEIVKLRATKTLDEAQQRLLDALFSAVL